VPRSPAGTRSCSAVRTSRQDLGADARHGGSAGRSLRAWPTS
jgi:hypothetical protein